MAGFDWDAEEGVFQSSQGPLERLGVTHVGRYRLERMVGAGGMGAVYAAHDDQLKRKVAVKVLLRAQRESPSLRRFQREADALARMRHPHLLGVHDAGEVQGTPYLVTEWIEGEELAERLKREGHLPFDEVCAIGLALADAVAYAHGQGILHRDIKPTNVVLTGTRGPVLIDFGLAKSTDPTASRLTATGAFAGTAGFASPEQLLGAQDIDERTDVYGLGATLYMALTGAPPLGHAQTFQELIAICAAGSIPPPSEHRPEIPRWLDAVIQGAMAPRAEERIQSARELARLLRLEEAPGDAAEDPAPRRGARRAHVGLGAVLVVLALAVGAGVGALPVLGSAASPSAAPSASSAPRFSPSPEGAAEPPAEGSLGRALDRLFAVSAAAAKEGMLSQSNARQRADALENAYQEALRVARALRPAPERALCVAQFLADSGRFKPALAALEGARGSRGVAARASLLEGFLCLAMPGEDLRARALTAFERATAAASAADESALEGTARALARALLEGHASTLPLSKAQRLIGRVSALPSAGEPDSLARRLHARWVWLTLSCLVERAKDREARMSLADALAGREHELPLPAWSQLFARFWIASLHALQISLPQQAQMELLVTHTPSSLNHRSVLAQSAGLGLHDGLRRLMALPVEPRVAPARFAEFAEAVSLQVAGPRARMLAQGPGWLTLELLPDRPSGRVLLDVDPKAKEWLFLLRGAEVDLDAMVRHDGPPLRGTERTLSGESMAADEALWSATPTTQGFHQLRVTGGIAFSEPIQVTVEIYVSEAEGGIVRWDWPWAVTPTGAVAAAREALPRARAKSLAGDTRGALEILSPWEERAPELLLVRASMLAQAGAWEALRELPLDRAQRSEVKRALTWARANAAMELEAWGTAETELKALLREHPNLLVAREALALTHMARGDLPAALAVLEAIRARDPAQRAAQALFRSVSAISGAQAPDDYVAGLQGLQGHVRGRRLVLRALLACDKPDLALRLLDSLSPALVGLTEGEFRVRALMALNRKDEARAALEPLLDKARSPARVRALLRLQRALGR